MILSGHTHAENVIYITKSLEFWHYETKGLVLVNKYAKDCDWYPKRLHAALSSKVLTPIDTFHLVVYKNLSPLSPGAPHPSGGNVRQLPGSAECNGWKKEHCPIIVGRVENISSSSTSQNCHLAFISLPHIFFTFLFVAKKCSEWLGAFLHKVGFTYKMENQETNNPIVALEIAQAHHFSFWNDREYSALLCEKSKNGWLLYELVELLKIMSKYNRVSYPQK